MLKILIAATSVGLPSVFAYLLHKHTNTHREIVRKVAHIGAAIAISVAPFYLSWGTVQLLAVILFFIVALGVHFGWGKSAYSVRRKTYGEVLFPVAVIGVSLFAPSAGIFCAAILHLGLADGFAAVIGTKWGKKSEYRVLGERKSIAGSIAFFATSLAILIGFNIWSNDPVSAVITIMLPLFATLFENLGLRGTDNITVPMLVVIALSTF